MKRVSHQLSLSRRIPVITGHTIFTESQREPDYCSAFDAVLMASRNATISSLHLGEKKLFFSLFFPTFVSALNLQQSERTVATTVLIIRRTASSPLVAPDMRLFFLRVDETKVKMLMKFSQYEFSQNLRPIKPVEEAVQQLYMVTGRRHCLF